MGSPSKVAGLTTAQLGNTDFRVLASRVKDQDNFTKVVTKTSKLCHRVETMRMSFFLLTLIGLIFDPSLATGNIYALDSLAIYDGLLMPENIIGTNLQNLVNFVASVVGWAFLVPLWRPQERARMDRVRRDTDNKDQTSSQDGEEDEVDKIEEVDELDNMDMGDKLSNFLPSAQTIATVLRSIADAADLY